MKNNLLDKINKKLSFSYTHTIQPSILVKTNVFHPSSLNEDKSNEKDNKIRNLLHTEGYDLVKIEGKDLNVRKDFLSWCGLLLAFSKIGFETNSITMPMNQFCAFCGIKKDQIREKEKKSILNSLDKIKTVSVEFVNFKNEHVEKTKLLESYVLSEKNITLNFDKKLWSLYENDIHILINIDNLTKIGKAEIAQCLYLFLVSLPNKRVPVVMSRMRNRIYTTMAKKEANQRIIKAIEKLEKIGAISGKWTSFNKEKAYSVKQK